MTVETYTTRCKPKSCPRCHGEMFIENDEDGWYEKCLQCSHRVGLDREADPTKNSALDCTALSLREKPTLKSANKSRLPSSIGRKKNDQCILTEEEWQALKRQNLKREIFIQQAERIF